MTAYITLSFDDGYKETIESVSLILEKYDFRGSFNVITGLVGKKFNGFELSNWDELKHLARMKHEIASHSVTHAILLSGVDLYLSRLSRFLNAITQSPHKFYHIKKSAHGFGKPRYPIDGGVDIAYELVHSKASIDRMIRYQTCTSFVYPGGTNCRKLEREVERAGYSSARGMKFGYNKLGALSKTSLRTQIWYSFTTVDDMNMAVARAAEMGFWLIECYHLVDKRRREDYEFFTRNSDFEKHLQYLRNLSNKGATVVDTQRSIIELLRGKQ